MTQKAAMAEAAAGPSTRRFPRTSLDTLLAIADALLPSLFPPANPSLPTSIHLADLSATAATTAPAATGTDSTATPTSSSSPSAALLAIQRFWEHKLDTSPAYIEAVCTAILEKIHPSVRSNLLLLLRILSSPIGCTLVLFYPCPSALSSWSLEDRVWALQRLRDSPLDKHREAFCGLKRLLCGIAMSYVEGGEYKWPYQLNPYWEAMDYAGPIHRYASAKRDAELIQEGKVFDFQKSGSILDIQDILDKDTTKKELVVTYDVVVIGSGCGGGVAAATLAEAGYSVLIVEKGPYISPENMSNLECEMFDQLYEQSSLLTTTDGNIMILAGSGVGGGSAINWGCCLETPLTVRKEWADIHGLEQFRPLGSDVKTEFDHSMKSVKERIGVISPCKEKRRKQTSGRSIEHNTMNQTLVSGCEKMGYDWEVSGQNYRDTKVDAAGYTCFGDRYGNKQSGLVTYLADAAKNGAKIIPSCKVMKILKTKNTRSGGRFKATGVLARVGDQMIRINANRCVISSAGSLHTPCVLLKSGFKNGHIGRHLHLHPVTCAVGLMPNDNTIKSREGVGVMSMLARSRSRKDVSSGSELQPPSFGGSILGWNKAPMTAVCNKFVSGPDGSGYGAKIECPSAHTGLMGVGLPWTSPTRFKETLSVAKNAATLIVLQRDRSEGRVCPDKNGLPQISYRLGDADRRSMTESLCGAMALLAKAGAKYLISGHSDDEGLSLEVPNDTEKDDAIQNYKESILTRGMPRYTMSVFSAHQMGTCRMGSSPLTSAVDEDGELWECDQLYVSDASVLPTASGANPMLTTLAISKMIANKIALRLRYEDDDIDEENEDELFLAIQNVARRGDRRTRANSLVERILNFIFSRWTAYFCATVATAAVFAALRDGNFILL